jgi:hypothetical protein
VRSNAGGCPPTNGSGSGEIHALVLEHFQRKLGLQEVHQSARGGCVLGLGGDAGGIGDLLLQLRG